MFGRTLLLTAGSVMLGAMPATAHFQLVYTPEVNVSQPGAIPVELIFWHPLAAAHAMNMGQPLEFFYIHRGERTDILDLLVPMTFRTAQNEAASFEAEVPLRTAGDYVLTLVAAPYYEAAEDKYIQQIATSYVNRGGLPTDWMNPIEGLPTQILPLNKPTNIIAGSTFTGQVLREGEPIPEIEIEVEYIAAPPDIATNSATPPVVGEMPGGAINAISDENGYFTFGIPRAGFWGFAALGSGPETEFVGAESNNEARALSQDAVIWIRAYDLE